MFNNSKNIISSNIIQNFSKINIKEIEPTIKNINTYTFEGDLNIVIDELTNLIFNEINKGEDAKIIKQQVLDYINNQMVILQQIYTWLLNNQTNSNSIYLLGYFNFNGIETNSNEPKAIELYQKAAELENKVAQYNLINEYIYGKSVKKNHNLAFKLSKKLAKEYACGMNDLGFCYENGIGTNFDGEKAFESYKKAADLGSINGIINLGWCYNDGIGIDTNKEEAFKLYKKAADLGSINGISTLGWCYYEGVGTDVSKQKAFELYQKAANLGSESAQYDLASMYEIGDGIKKDIDQAIYWYKKSAALGYPCSQEKLNQFQKNELNNI
jgi:TPR repeat protein